MRSNPKNKLTMKTRHNMAYTPATSEKRLSVILGYLLNLKRIFYF